MILHYHPQLKELFRGNNPNSDVALNKSFADWQTLIERELKVRCGWKENYDSNEEEKALFRYAQEHRRHFQQDITANEVLVLVHPLYLPLTHMHLLKTNQQREEVNVYLRQLLDILERVKEKQQQQVVILETLYHYAAATSLFLENGLVGGTVFTEYDSGRLYPTDNLKRIKQKKLFVGGAYNRCCLKKGLKEIETVTTGEDMMVIPEFIFDHPEDAERSTLKSQQVIFDNGSIQGIIPPKRHLSIEDLIKRWQL